MVHRVELAQRLFHFLVALIRAVEHAAAGGPRTIVVERVLARLDHVRIERHAHVVVGAKQDRIAPVADRAGGGKDLLHHQREWIFHPAGQQALAHGDDVIEL